MTEETKKLLDHCVEYATELLTETGEAYPFGGFVDTIGNVHPMEMEINKKDVPHIWKVVETLSKFGNTEMDEDRMQAYAVTYEVEIALSQDEKTDAIAIDIKHHEEETPIYYLPFQKTADGDMMIGKLFAVNR
ncbi:MAG: hypothetical protein HUJ25_08070 [Crocinitomicaceae bacterium]|nr:hypothetical protein [Crocinitomicaceae bacterium]